MLVEQGVDPELEVVCAWHRGNTEPDARVLHECQHESSIRKQRGLKFDDVSFMTSRRFYGKRFPAASTGRRIEYAPRYNPSKRGRFRGVWDVQGNYADLD